MPEIHLLTGAYALDALDALDDLERRGFERHLRTCATCFLEVTEFREAAAGLAERVATPAPEAMRARVMAQVAVTRQVSPGTRPSLPRFSLRRLVAVAATVLLIAAGAGLGTVAWQGHRTAQSAQVEAARIARVMTAPGRIEVVGTPSVGGRATVVAADGSAVFATDRLPAPPAGKAYQLWVIDARGVRSAGLLKLTGGTAQSLVSGVSNGARVAVSVEPDSGSKQPTTTPVLNLRVV
jgi:Anti-sigma-K factor rskA